MIYLRIIILFFILNFRIYSYTISAGFGLWQHDLRFINTLDLGWEQTIGNFQYVLELPVFFPWRGYPFVYATPQKNSESSFKSLSETRYLTAILSKAVYDSPYIAFGLDDKRHFFRQSFLRGDPLFDPNVPFLGSHLFIESPFISLCTSAIQDPSLAILYSDLKFLSKDMNTSFSHYVLRPLFWVDMYLLDDKKTAFGASFEGSVMFAVSENHLLGGLGGISYEQKMLRSVVEVVYEYTFFQVSSGILIQDKQRKASIILNSMYPALRDRNNPSPSHDYILGERLSLYIGGDMHFFEIEFEVYNFETVHFNLLAVYSLRWEKFSLSLEYVNEDITSFNDLLQANNKSTFFGFDLSALILKDIMRIGWSSYRNWNGESNFRSRLYTKLLF